MIDNIAFSFFGINIYWYGIVYSLGFLISYFFILYFSENFGFKKSFIEDIYVYLIIFSIIFGRLFHILFYNLDFYILNPLEIFRFDHGGMSIHGGFFGGFLIIFYFSKIKKFNFLRLTDLMVIPLSFFLAIGRLANFLNQELVGKVTNSSFFGMIFPKIDNNLRWPTTLFESIKNIFVFEILLYFDFILKKSKIPGFLTGWFLILYNFLRFFIDFLRTPDQIVFGIISMGQFLSLLFGFIGFFILFRIYFFKNRYLFGS